MNYSKFLPCCVLLVVVRAYGPLPSVSHGQPPSNQVGGGGGAGGGGCNPGCSGNGCGIDIRGCANLNGGGIGGNGCGPGGCGAPNLGGCPGGQCGGSGGRPSAGVGSGGSGSKGSYWWSGNNNPFKPGARPTSQGGSHSSHNQGFGQGQQSQGSYQPPGHGQVGISIPSGGHNVPQRPVRPPTNNIGSSSLQVPNYQGSYNQPQPQPLKPPPQPHRPPPQPHRPPPQPHRPPPQPAPQLQPQRPPRPPPALQPQAPQQPYAPPPQSQPHRPQPAPQPQPHRPQPAPQPQPHRPPNRPHPQPQPGGGSYQQSQPARPSIPPNNFIPLGMSIGGMNMMMMPMGMPVRGGSCSAGSFCVPRNTCNPYNGFIIRNVNTVPAVIVGQPEVPLLDCFVPANNVQDGVCCQESHPIIGPNGQAVD